MSPKKRERLAQAFIERCKAEPSLAHTMPSDYFKMAKVEKEFFLRTLKKGGLRRNLEYAEQGHKHLWEAAI